MSDENYLVWINKKTNQIATKVELEEMWEKPKHDFELKEISQEKIDNNNIKTPLILHNIHNQNTINLKNNSKTNDSTQIILGLLSPLIITFILLLLFPPCFFWCSGEEGGFYGSLVCCHFLFISAGFVNSKPKYSLSFIISIIPSASLAFFLWMNIV